ncbi:MAG: hypothetical protein EWV85_14805 [Microcystis aeruginosa Ma_QC_C_20070703_M131]|uniref:Uncharacterized protein n=1 Tax=Microcystis aeruginosa Ma_QC_C_20070703_M131 TaxID=2486263 RepID=A0A551XW12_MICAE|nr:MAG: hypothetical protein EWV85_14805 [Microcystis aeruginosa Ma_QC_C_20070703_M131]
MNNGYKYLSKINYTYLTTFCLLPILTKKLILSYYLAVLGENRPAVKTDFFLAKQLRPFDEQIAKVDDADGQLRHNLRILVVR